MYSGYLRRHSRIVSPSVRQIPQTAYASHHERVLPMDGIQLFLTIHLIITKYCIQFNTAVWEKILHHDFLLTKLSTGGNIQFIYYWNWVITTFSLHISVSAILHLVTFGIWSNNKQSVKYVICVMIVQALWYIWVGNTIHNMLRIYANRGAPFCILTVKWCCPPLARTLRFAGGAPAVNHKATAIWLAHCEMNTLACTMEIRFLNIYRYNSLHGRKWMNASKIILSYLQIFVLYLCQIL